MEDIKKERNEDEKSSTVENTDDAFKDNKKGVRRKLPEKGTEEYRNIRREDAKRRRSERIDAHKCPHCEYTAPFPNKVRLHIDTIHSTGRFKCDTCVVYFDDYRFLRAHMKEVHPIIYSCTQCKFTSKRKAGLLKHVNISHINGIKCTFPGCSIILLKRQLKKHLAECHPTESKSLSTAVKIAPFIHHCDLCVFTTSDFNAFEEHLSKHKTVVSCPFNECDRTIAMSELDSHICEDHSEEEVYNIPKKESASKEATPSRVDAHLLLENDNDSSTRAEEDCVPDSENLSLDEDISRLEAWERGAENVDEGCEGMFKCILCPGTFKTLVHLRKHTKRVHEKLYKKETQREKKHKCIFEGCSKSFTTIGLLNDHLNVHNNITPYSCEHCNQQFHARARFAVHLSKYHQMSIKSYEDIRRNLL